MATAEVTTQVSAINGEKDDGSNMVTQWKQRRISLLSNPPASQIEDATKRRRSTFKGLATTITSLLDMRRRTKGRLSIPEIVNVPKMENSYQMKPDPTKTFRSEQVQAIADRILEQVLASEKYKPSTCSKLVCDISQTIQDKVKRLSIPRYRVIVHVAIGPCNDQSIQMASRCLWDASTDTHCSATYRNESLLAVATVYGVYYE